MERSPREFCEFCLKLGASAFFDCGHLSCSDCYTRADVCPICNARANVLPLDKVAQKAPHLAGLFQDLKSQLEGAEQQHAALTAVIKSIEQSTEVELRCFVLHTTPRDLTFLMRASSVPREPSVQGCRSGAHVSREGSGFGEQKSASGE
jgi:hypothetical protein